MSEQQKAAQLKRSPEAKNEKIWIPNLWKRSNMTFTTAFTSIMLTIITEFSFWENFGTYIWFIIIGLTFVGSFYEIYLEFALKDWLNMAPCLSTFTLFCGLVTFGADDFKDFMLSFVVEYIMLTMQRCIIDPSLHMVIKWLYLGWVKILKFIVETFLPLDVLKKMVFKEEAPKRGTRSSCRSAI